MKKRLDSKKAERAADKAARAAKPQAADAPGCGGVFGYCFGGKPQPRVGETLAESATVVKVRAQSSVCHRRDGPRPGARLLPASRLSRCRWIMLHVMAATAARPCPAAACGCKETVGSGDASTPQQVTSHRPTPPGTDQRLVTAGRDRYENHHPARLQGWRRLAG
jgi:hypothetical protein